MVKITLIGTGNIAACLYRFFAKEDTVKIVQVLGRKNDSFAVSEKYTIIGKGKIKKADIYIIAVSDSAIPVVSKLLANEDGLVVHTSGSMALNNLPIGIRRGVFYPLQTFTKNRDINFRAVPICIEAESKKDSKLLRKLASTISDRVFEIDTKQRKSLHLAAIFVNNFTNHLYYIGQQLCEKNQIPFELLTPLIQETVKKIEELSPFEAQTGPAKRSDTQTLKNQLNQLNTKNHKEIYSLLTKSIQNTYGKKL